MTTELLAAFEIIGLPAPQGSKTKMPNGAMVEGSSASGRLKHTNWRSDIATAARDFMQGDAPFDGALLLMVTFRVPMPKSRPAAAHADGARPCTVMPDLDKLIRTLGDGLKSGGMISDDARIYRIEADKFEVHGWTGAEVVLRRWTP